MSLWVKTNLRQAIFFIALAVGLSACESTCAKKQDEQEANIKKHGSVAALVNGKSISQEKLEELHSRAADKFGRTHRELTEDVNRKMRAGILRKLIDDELIAQRAQKEGVSADRFERVDAFQKYKMRMGGQKGYDLFLKQQGLTEEQVLNSIVADLNREKLVKHLGKNQTISEEEIKGHYNANQKLYTMPETVRARHILLRVSDKDPAEKVQLVAKKAAAILEEAKKPGASFTDLVQKYSEGPSVKKNGDLGFFARGRMVKEFEDVAFNAKLKTPVGPVKTDFGYHIIYVEEKKPSRIGSLEEVRPRIVEFMQRNKMARMAEEILFDLRKKAKLSIKDYSMTLEEYREVSNAEQMAVKEAKAKK